MAKKNKKNKKKRKLLAVFYEAYPPGRQNFLPLYCFSVKKREAPTYPLVGGICSRIYSIFFRLVSLISRYLPYIVGIYLNLTLGTLLNLTLREKVNV